MIVLGIETSCDETAGAICQNGQILASVLSSQSIHNIYGGVVPEVASREHERLLNAIIDETLKQAKIKKTDIDVISVTHGPGLAGALLTGVSFAKGLGLGLEIPVIPINHLEAHIYANFMADPSLQYPFVCLLVSGGHTQIWLIKKFGSYTLLGETRDDAAGEAFDKGARILGLGYPGGPEIEKLGKEGDPRKIAFPKALMEKGSLEFSFSGLKTSLLYYMDSFSEKTDVSKPDVAASYQFAIVEILVEKMKRAIDKTGVKTCVIAGGVAANLSLRSTLEKRLKGVKILLPDLKYCTDNAAMIAYLGELKSQNNKYEKLDFPIYPNLKLAK
ncbi:MAG: tRNA (adenosine(37)-N6)-threonylcarbamoyltransferase complex transferase subunit TsaD [Candidatus Marinimicrobia bacterium]|nr:tRNA (adenosine(37)-N6)-threonylcarbamoyltransferase complex transferase subunit TsaD [Candidatus Neomarinimicrobiota bacterium]MBT3496367.1 tRNA (adenosine(37)-N6)-threonylcarbamoyltransferase complex transferase subunit TsaD [Candidatus Neomarinimicrobiota bacterium]MBT3692578.1 tRNA (adenosine(37)-N6)-threonylcarbamoyltransferase complex transferase subunit TsaD [Candidatus Neomarinimicrobiota bacterium]MBT3731997.1 tRNA (adenosine(37)-N6)-threonylcarbamoyltransferase complex transferase s